MEELRKRIIELLKVKGISLNKVANHNSNVQVKFSRQINHTCAITFDTIRYFLDFFPDLNAEWLMRGKGEMLKKPAYNSLLGLPEEEGDHIANKVEESSYVIVPEEYDRKMKERTERVSLSDEVLESIREQQEKIDEMQKKFGEISERLSKPDYFDDMMKLLIQQNQELQERLSAKKDYTSESK